MKRNNRCGQSRQRVSGQAMTEYVVALVAVVLLLTGVEIVGNKVFGVGPISAFMGAIGTFFLNVLRVICLPFP